MKKIGFVGIGNMAEAMIGGMLQSGEFSSEQILVTNKNNSERLKKIQTKFNVEYFSKKELVEKSDVLIIAVKPQDLKEVLLDIKDIVKKDILIISVVAGIDIESVLTILAKGYQSLEQFQTHQRVLNILQQLWRFLKTSIMKKLKLHTKFYHV